MGNFVSKCLYLIAKAHYVYDAELWIIDIIEKAGYDLYKKKIFLRFVLNLECILFHSLMVSEFLFLFS